MRIARVETVRHERWPRFLWVRVHTEDGLVGLGEVGHHAAAAAEVVHEYAERFLLGADASRIDHLWTTIYQAMTVTSPAGSELRALAAVEVALWDIAGKAAGLPVYRLLGGATRETIPIYNTCIGEGPMPDRRRFQEDAGGLAAELLDSGYQCMKIWPFDPYARKTHGQYLSNADLDAGLAPVRAIRERVGDEMGVAIELHGFWNLPCAIQIARALEPYRVQWVEEALSPESVRAQAEFAAVCPAPVVSGERIHTRFGLRGLLELGAAHIVNPDLTWTGGIGELKRMAAMAEAFRRPIKPHNEGGPVHHVACAHVAANVPSLYLLETIRSNMRHVFPDLVDGLPDLVRVEGELRLGLPAGPGLGVSLRREVLAGAVRRVSERAA